ncbi:MAG TPA: 3-phosphoserine/phosphohydroxythreonine transaminase, partial [Gemmatimonadales bacterium]|nr:3-phosphoserine/phosphohydroxythreonine transaminase [Gemmatimonadales bacterium]
TPTSDSSHPTPMPTDRIHNFSAGPAALPESVLRKAQEAIWNVAGSGIGIMEHSHRGKVFDRIIAEAEQDCRSLADIPDNYRVLFLQGGASLQFARVPMNLLRADRTADYLVTGVWSQKAVKEAKPIGKVHIAASSESTNFDRIPQPGEIKYSSSPVYVHITTNNTIFGTQWRAEPTIPAGVPLIADTSSDMYSRPIDIRKYGIIYAGAQKNLGPSGVVLVIIRDDLIEAGAKDLPTMLQYRTHSAENSLYNTPPTFGIYFMGEVFKWIKSQGGLASMAEHNESKARLLYDYLDSSEFFRGTAQPDSRSQMNVCFRAPTEELEAKFISEATKRGLDGLKGHRSVGGMRASIYNACPRQAVEDLVKFMKEFERANRAAAART